MKVVLESQSNARLGECTRREIIQGLGALGVTLALPSAGRTARAFSQESPEPPLHAKLRINLELRLGTIDPFLYGHFLEHLGRCVYEGIYDEGSPLSDSDGNRKDVLAAARRLRVTQLRWPGGNFASGYHWQDGGAPGTRARRVSISLGSSANRIASAPTNLSTRAESSVPSHISASIWGRGPWMRRQTGWSTATMKVVLTFPTCAGKAVMGSHTG